MIALVVVAGPCGKGHENAAALDHPFPAGMAADTHFPAPLLEKGQRILLDLCASIEAALPASNDAILVQPRQATEAFNDLAGELGEAGGELETTARDAAGTEMGFLPEPRGFTIDIGDAIAPREW